MGSRETSYGSGYFMADRDGGIGYSMGVYCERLSDVY